jgi:hypothetical protein
MRITIKRNEKQETEKTGFFGKRTYTIHKVLATVEFSEVELATIRQHNLGDAALIEEEMEILGAPYHYRYTINDLIKDKTLVRGYPTPLEANRFEHELKTEILPNLKAYIEGNTSQGATTETFEL